MFLFACQKVNTGENALQTERNVSSCSQMASGFFPFEGTDLLLELFFLLSFIEPDPGTPFQNKA